MKLAFVLLGHQYPKIIERLMSALTAAGHTVVLHYDKRSDDSDFEYLRHKFEENTSVRFATRVKVRWGEWSICKATLNCISEIEKAQWQPDYVYYASGADYPIRSSKELVQFLEENHGKDFIEGVPTDKKKWVKGGPEQERYQYRFYTNWRDHPKLSRQILNFQQALKLQRKFVLGLEPYMGSQWWVLTWRTLEKVMELARRPDVQRFFSSTLIPDELFFQTLVCNLVPSSQIIARPLTLYQFTDYMVPIIFCADRVEYLSRQPFFLARKMSPHRPQMFDDLDKIWLGGPSRFPLKKDEAARISPEYEENRLRCRDGAPGVPLYGKPVQKWYEDLGRLDETYFAVIGTSTIELKIAYLLLSCSKKLLCHGQIFHPKCIEFANQSAEFAGYKRHSITLRNMSAPNFVANLVRAAPDKTTGFLIRSGQGWHVPEIIFDRPNPRAFLLWGDPLISFAESLSQETPTLDAHIDWNLIDAIPTSVLARKWSTFILDFSNKINQLDKLVDHGVRKKSLQNWNWLTEMELDLTKPSRIPAQNPILLSSDLAGWGGMTLARWRDWMQPAGKNLGVHFGNIFSSSTWQEVKTVIFGLEAGRRILIRGLAAGGVDLNLQYDPPNNDIPIFAPIMRRTAAKNELV